LTAKVTISEETFSHTVISPLIKPMPAQHAIEATIAQPIGIPLVQKKVHEPG